MHHQKGLYILGIACVIVGTAAFIAKHPVKNLANTTDQGQIARAPAQVPAIESNTPSTQVTSPKLTTYRANMILNGTRSDLHSQVFVNNSTHGIVYHGLGWTADFPIVLGDTKVRIQMRSIDGKVSSEDEVTVHRDLAGDINGDHTVDNADLLAFLRLKNQNSPTADFNEDGKVDDHDMSLLVSNWEKTY